VRFQNGRAEDKGNEKKPCLLGGLLHTSHFAQYVTLREPAQAWTSMDHTGHSKKPPWAPPTITIRSCRHAHRAPAQSPLVCGLLGKSSPPDNAGRASLQPAHLMPTCVRAQPTRRARRLATAPHCSWAWAWAWAWVRVPLHPRLGMDTATYLPRYARHVLVVRGRYLITRAAAAAAAALQIPGFRQRRGGDDHPRPRRD
jgi:hypothetical protein